VWICRHVRGRDRERREVSIPHSSLVGVHCAGDSDGTRGTWRANLGWRRVLRNCARGNGVICLLDDIRTRL